MNCTEEEPLSARKRKAANDQNNQNGTSSSPTKVKNNDVSPQDKHEEQKRVDLNIPENLDPNDPAHFDHFLFHLLSYRAQKQTFAVAKADDGSDGLTKLFEFTQFVKKEYHSSLEGASHLTPRQFEVLESLHFPFTTRGDGHWNRFYGLLEQYRKDHGHVIVPRYCEVPGLGEWVADQRRQHKFMKQGHSSQMTPERMSRLEALGFAWQVRQRTEWDERFKELEVYEKQFGHCRVPQKYSANKRLGRWVAKQREQYKLLQKGQHSFLNDYRVEKLEKLGFSWEGRVR